MKDIRGILGFTLYLVIMTQAYAKDGWLADSRNNCKAKKIDSIVTEMKWSGTCKDGYVTGSRILLWYQGEQLYAIVNGSFAKGQMNGKNIITLSDGSKFVAEFIDNKFKDPIKIIDVDGTMYENYTTISKKSSKGKLTLKNGDVYTGDFLDNAPTGEGILVTVDGFRYEGFFKKGDFQQGKVTLPDGSFFVGTFENKCPKYGKYTRPDGLTYEGYFVNGQMTTQGKVIYPDGRVAEEGTLINVQLSWQGIPTSIDYSR